MGRMKSLLTKSMWQFTISTVVILICCYPLFFLVMKHYYAEDLDELIIFRSNEFVSDHQSGFTSDEIVHWNKYNEDMQIKSATQAGNILDKDMHHVIQKPFYNKAEGHEVDYRIYYTDITIEGNPYILMSRIAMIEDEDLRSIVLGLYSIFFVVLLLCMFVVQRFLSKKLWNPFYDSLSRVENFDIDKGNIPHFKDTTIKEFDRLNKILLGLIGNNQKAYNQQKEFVQNASHELQTPLAVFQSKLDVFFQEPDLTEEQVQTIHSLYDILSRLTRLNKNLLLLARLDNNQFKETEKLDFNDILKTQLNLLSILVASENITISVDISDYINLSANKILLESLINNLVVNAIRHNTQGDESKIKIEVAHNSFVVKNTGEKKALDSELIFRRFSRTSENNKGNGLGLSIAYQICKLHNWTLSYSYCDAMHCFRVQF